MDGQPVTSPSSSSPEAEVEFNLTEFLTSITAQVAESVNLELLQGLFNQDSIISQWVVTALSILLTLVFVCAFVAFGWWIVWICFLSRFKFVRELLLGNSTTPPPEESPPPSTSRKPKGIKRRRD